MILEQFTAKFGLTPKPPKEAESWFAGSKWEQMDIAETERINFPELLEDIKTLTEILPQPSTQKLISQEEASQQRVIQIVDYLKRLLPELTQLVETKNQTGKVPDALVRKRESLKGIALWGRQAILGYHPEALDNPQPRQFTADETMDPQERGEHKAGAINDKLHTMEGLQNYPNSRRYAVVRESEQRFTYLLKNLENYFDPKKL